MGNKIFDLNQTVNIKNWKVQGLVLCVLSFIIVPIINALISLSSDESPVYTSLSRIAWVHGLIPIVILFGLLNIATFTYGLFQFLETGLYVKAWKILSYVLTAISSIILISGVSIPAYYIPDDPYYVALRSAHGAMSGIGIVSFFIILVMLNITTYFRNVQQGIIGTMILCAMLIAAGYTIFVVNDKDSYCTTSGVAQILIFTMYNIAMTLFGIFNTAFKPKTE